MGKEENINPITENKDVANEADKRVLVVGKLKGLKEDKKSKTKKGSKAKTSKTSTASAKEKSTKNVKDTKIIKEVKKSDPKKQTTAKTTKEGTKKVSVETQKAKKAQPKTAKKEVSKKTSNKNEEKKETTKQVNKKGTHKNEESKKEKNKKETVKKVENKGKDTKNEKLSKLKLGIEKLEIVEKIDKLIKREKKNKDKEDKKNKKDNKAKKNKIDKNNKAKKDKENNEATKKNKTKRASAQLDVLRVQITSEEFIKNAKNVVIGILVLALAISLIYIGSIGKSNVSNKVLYSSLSKDIKMEELTNNGEAPTNAIKTLQQENPEIKGWIKIDGTNINYPLLQGLDNKYYLTHNFKNEKTKYGSIFVNTNSDLNNDKSNIIIYGHDMRDGQMFSDLIKYADKSYYDEHKTIKITTDQNENEYAIVSAFKSKVFYQDEKNVFRFYQYYNLEDEKQFNEYINNCRKLQLYNTGVKVNYGDQLVTLITCDYSNENGRMVVVAKKN